MGIHVDSRETTAPNAPNDDFVILYPLGADDDAVGYYFKRPDGTVFTLASLEAAQTWTDTQSMTSPAITTSLTTPSTTFAALAGATTLLSIGGTGGYTLAGGGTIGTAVNAITGTLEQSATTGSLTVAGGVYIAKKINVVGTAALGATTITGALSATGAANSLSVAAVSSINATSGSGAGARLMLLGGTVEGNIFLLSQGYTTNKQYVQSGMTIEADHAGGINISARAGPVKIWNADSATPTATITSTGLAVTGNVVISTAGKGIDFSAASETGTSSLLDDYEEGTWTPTLLDTSNDPNEGQTYTADNGGFYVKIGRVVYITGRLAMGSIGTLDTAQRVNIGGLPFTAAAAVDGQRGTLHIGTASSLALATANQVVTLLVNSGTTRIAMDTWTSTAGTTQTTVGQVSADADLLFSGLYFT